MTHPYIIFRPVALPLFLLALALILLVGAFGTTTASAWGCSILVTPSSITSGESAILKWSADSDVDYVTINQFGDEHFATSGERTISPMQTTTYIATLHKESTSATSSCQTTLTVTAPLPVPSLTRLYPNIADDGTVTLANVPEGTWAYYKDFKGEYPGGSPIAWSECLPDFTSGSSFTTGVFNGTHSMEKGFLNEAATTDDGNYWTALYADCSGTSGYYWTATRNNGVWSTQSTPTVGPTVVTGDITTDTVWTKAQSPYLINQSITIKDGATLTIEHGVIVKIGANQYLSASDGSLRIQGTEADSVFFTDYRDDSIGGDTNGDGNATAPSWLSQYGGIEVNNFQFAFQSKIDIQHAHIKYAGDAAISLKGSDVQATISDSVIESSNIGVRIFFGAKAVIDNVEFYDGDFGVDIDHDNSTVQINNSTFHNLKRGLVLGFWSLVGARNIFATVANSIFENNSEAALTVGHGTANVENNWWGDASGPTHETNPTGTGGIMVYDTDSTVDFTPWLTARPAGQLKYSSVHAETAYHGYNDFNGNTGLHFFALEPTDSFTPPIGARYQIYRGAYPDIKDIVYTSSGCNLTLSGSEWWRNVYINESELQTFASTTGQYWALFTPVVAGCTPGTEQQVDNAWYTNFYNNGEGYKVGIFEPTNHAPVITLIGDNPMTITQGSVFVDPGATAHDDEDGDITDKISTITIDTSVLGTTTITYLVSDSEGLVATETREVVVTEISSDWDKYSTKPILHNTCNSLFPYNLAPETNSNLIIITHGYNDNAQGWVEKLRKDILSKKNGGITTYVETFDWHEDAATRLPREAYDNAVQQGETCLAKEIIRFQPRHVHLIAHSAGSNVIQSAVDTLALYYHNQANTPSIHLTFLDAYAPNKRNERYGSMTAFNTPTYAEQYVDVRTLNPAPYFILNGFADLFDSTDTWLPNAANFNVTPLAPASDVEPNNREYIQWAEYASRVHRWPVDVYSTSTSQPSYKFGFPFSVESGASGNLAQRKLDGVWCDVSNVGQPYNACKRSSVEKVVRFGEDYADAFDDNVLTLGYATIDLTKATINNATIFAEATIDLGNATIDLWSTAITGGVDLLGDAALASVNWASQLKPARHGRHSMRLKTGSPSWIAFTITTKEPINILDFDYIFPSNAGEGVFAVFIDGMRVFSRDGTLNEHDKVLHGQVMLPNMLEVGKHTIIYRLDTVSGEQEEVHLANIRLGTQTSIERTLEDDTIAPTTIPTISSTLGKNGWYISSTTVQLKAVDNEGGVGVQKTEYSLDNGPWLVYASTSPIAITTEGKHTILYRSTDWFGNTEATGTVAVNIDLTAPEAKISADILLKDLKVIGNDNLSSTTVTKDATGNYTITDQAGHTTKLIFKRTYTGRMLTLAKLTGIQYDNAPVVTLPSSSFIYVWTPNTSVPALNNQTVIANKTFTIHATYDKRTNKTSVVVLQRGQQFKKQSYPGLKIVTLTTNKGNVGYEL